MDTDKAKPIPALMVTQWRESWSEVNTVGDDRSPPPHHFYVMSMPARILRALSGVERRSIEERLQGGRDKGIQRALDENRSKEIASFIKSGYPWSTLSKQKQNAPEYQALKMPGWLPTAVVINVKLQGDSRPSGNLHESDVVSFQDLDGGLAEMTLPVTLLTLPWDPIDSHPIEIIDGQHRLWAFDELNSDEDFELPVVAFHGLDVAWQAYLFYVINIKPKKINTSLAYDLYPLLREQDWLEGGEAHIIYREARAQELTEALWSYPKSPWYQRINMLGETGGSQVRQASWVRSLTATLIRKRTGKNVLIGGLFGAPEASESQWNRIDQAAILIAFWIELEKASSTCEEAWAFELRKVVTSGAELGDDRAFTSKKSLLNSDMGVRGLLHVLNDMLMISRNRTELSEWQTNQPNDRVSNEAIGSAIEDLNKQHQIAGYFEQLASELIKFDWRTADAPGIADENLKTKKLTYRGSGGYNSLRFDILKSLLSSPEPIKADASKVLDLLDGEYGD